jgi:hypothetical protein
MQSDHFSIFASIQLEDRPRRATKWKMSSYHLDAIQLEIVHL